MKKIIYFSISTLMVFILGCADSFVSVSDTSKDKKDEDTKLSRGKFTAKQILPPLDTSRYTIGCKEDGSPEPDFQIDPRLKLDGLFDFAFSIKTWEDEPLVARYVQTVKKMAEGEIDFEVLVKSITGVPDISPGTRFALICEVVEEDGRASLNCKTDPPLPSIEDIKSLQCNIDINEDSDFDVTLEKGEFEFPNSSKTVVAYRINTKITGKLICGKDEKEIGRGSVFISLIASNEVPSLDVMFCGGTTLSVTYETRDENEVVIESSIMDLLEYN